MTHTDENLLREFRAGSFCEWCRKRTPHGTDPAHLFARGMSSGSRVDLRINLCSLCRPCHAAHHWGREPTRYDLLALVAAREGTTQDAIERAVFKVLRAPKGSDLSEVLK